MPRLPRHSSLAVVFLLSATACVDGVDGPGEPVDNDPPLASRDDLYQGAPDPEDIPSEWKVDGPLPASFDLRDLQSPVQSQARRGVCSIFSTVGLMEHLYIAEGTLPDVDFSEQYLQWAVKFQVGAFTNTSGSNSRFNIQAIQQFGIPEEAAWPYEPDQWNELNDPACAAGEDPDAPLPTRCYTNGEPSAEALAAERFFLPGSRFLSRNDVKAHMHNRKQAVIADMDFFYQAWNHRKSTLPVNADNWNDGIVLFPNAEDRAVSLVKRAGHSIVLVGWDDAMEVPVRDKDGNTVAGPDGALVTEKGFYLFKNSWGTAGFGIENPFGPGYGWISQRYIHEIASMRVSDLPTVTPPVEACGDGVDNDRDDQIDCDDADCAAAPECADGGTEITVDGPAGQAIPDNDPAGVSATLEVGRTGAIGGLTVRLALDHTYRGDLRVTLTHGDRTLVLHDRAGGSADDLVLEVETAEFDGLDVGGAWRLLVVDRAAVDVGTIERWSITALVD